MTAHNTAHLPENQATGEPGQAAGPGSQVASAPAWEVTEMEQAARAVMHPDTSDSDWRYYHGTIAGS